jgi:prepilin-type N-terminal cleavage/methylation domain-containing protein
MTKRDGFTLFEIVIAVFVLLLLLGLAVPSLSGVLADKRLHRSLDRFNVLVGEAHERSLADHRAYLIVWSDGEILLRPAVVLKTEEHPVIDSIAVSRSEKWKVEFPAALTKKTLPEWIFWESGVCEPLRVRFASSNGSWTAEYSPLSAFSEIVSYAPR